MKNPNCEGLHCTSNKGEVRKLPAGSGNMLLCRSCYDFEIKFRKEQNAEMEGTGTYFDLPLWHDLEVYVKPPVIDFCFSGWVRGATITEANNADGETVDVSTMPAEELAEKLECGELFIALGNYLYASRKNEIEIFDFEANTD
jgi:hypothetical protein